MKHFIKLLQIVFILIVNINANAQNNEVIDNNKLIELTNLKMGDELIISFMKSSKTNFECDMANLVQLKKEKVSDNVLLEVRKICNGANSTREEANNANNPLHNHPSGVYIYEEGNTGSVLKKLYATVVSNEKSGGAGQAFAQSFSYGFAKSSAIVQLNGQTANVKTNQNSVFYFYFDVDEKPGMANWWFTKATSPNEFTLIKMKSKKNNREFRKGKSDSYTYQTGIDEDQKVQFSFEEVKPGIFKVKSKATLKEGEYCFIYSASVPSQYSNDKVFDFTVVR